MRLVAFLAIGVFSITMVLIIVLATIGAGREQRQWLEDHDCKLLELGFRAKWDCRGLIYWSSTEFAE